MCNNNGLFGGNSCWGIIILLIVLWACCGNNGGCGNSGGCGCGCGNDCGC